MSYVTVAVLSNESKDFKEQYDAGTLTPGRVAQWVAKVESIVDSFCGTLYTVPFTVSIPVITHVAAELVLALFVRENDTHGEREKDWKDRWDRAMKLLALIAKGEKNLYDDAGAIVSMKSEASMVPTSNRESVGPIFDMHPEEQQAYDPEDFD